VLPAIRRGGDRPGGGHQVVATVTDVRIHPDHLRLSRVLGDAPVYLVRCRGYTHVLVTEGLDELGHVLPVFRPGEPCALGVRALRAGGLSPPYGDTPLD